MPNYLTLIGGPTATAGVGNKYWDAQNRFEGLSPLEGLPPSAEPPVTPLPQIPPPPTFDFRMGMPDEYWNPDEWMDFDWGSFDPFEGIDWGDWGLPPVTPPPAPAAPQEPVSGPTSRTRSPYEVWWNDGQPLATAGLAGATIGGIIGGAAMGAPGAGRAQVYYSPYGRDTRYLNYREARDLAGGAAPSYGELEGIYRGDWKNMTPEEISDLWARSSSTQRPYFSSVPRHLLPHSSGATNLGNVSRFGDDALRNMGLLPPTSEAPAPYGRTKFGVPLVAPRGSGQNPADIWSRQPTRVQAPAPSRPNQLDAAPYGRTKHGVALTAPRGSGKNPASIWQAPKPKAPPRPPKQQQAKPKYGYSPTGKPLHYAPGSGKNPRSVWS